MDPHQVYQEVAEHVKADTPITADTLAKLPYLKAFVKETFRLWPNGTEVSRYCEQVTRSPTSCPPTPSYSQDLVLSDHHIPAGTHLDLNPSVHFKDPDLFPDPEVHSPERWLGPSIHPHSLRSRHADVRGQEVCQAGPLRASGPRGPQVPPQLLLPARDGPFVCRGSADK